MFALAGSLFASHGKGAAAPRFQDPEPDEAVTAAAAAAAGLAERTEQTREAVSKTMNKVELARRVPLVGRAAARMTRRQHVGQLSLAWEGMSAFSFLPPAPASPFSTSIICSV